MTPYAKRNERKVGAARPQIAHTGAVADVRTPPERKRQKEEVKAARRAIKKGARRELKRQLTAELEENP